MTKLPECMTVELNVFVVSDSTGLQARVGVGGRVDLDLLKAIDEDALNGLVKAACGTLNEAAKADDARPMTAEEARAYRKDDAESSGSLFHHVVSAEDFDEEDDDV